ncbi:MAG: hypothetical protein ACRDIF_00270 [Actinomycetota bacterium]
MIFSAKNVVFALARAMGSPQLELPLPPSAEGLSPESEAGRRIVERARET